MMGLIKGFAEGTSDRITKEREEEKTLIANRFKMAAINKKQREEEDKVKKEAAKARNEQINTLLPGASLEQRLALMSNETMFNLAIENKDVLADKEKLDEFIVINKEKIPANFKTVQDYINSLTSKPQGPSKMPEMQTREVFFSRVSPDQRQMDAMASQYGSSAADLLAYEGVTEAEAMPSFGSVNLDVIKTPKKLATQIEELRTSLVDASPEEQVAITSKIEELVAFQNVGQSPKTLKEEADRISVRLLKATGEEKAKLQSELNRVNNNIRSNAEAQAQEKDRAATTGGKPLTFNETLKMVEQAQVSSLSKQLGMDVIKQGKMIETVTDPDGTTRERIRAPRAGDAPEITRVAEQGAVDYLKATGHIKPDGSLTNYALNILTAKGIDPNKVTPAAPAAPATPATPAAPAAPATAETPAELSPEEEQAMALAWAEANPTDPRAAAVKEKIKNTSPGIK